MIDLRSDTVTKPSPEMLQAMVEAQVGDDVFGEDPTVNELQSFAADMFGMEAALYCASGTQTNQIAIKLHTKPGDEVICDKLSHIYLYEGGGIASNSGASVRLLEGNLGRFTAEQVLENINDKNNIHFPISSLVSIENTVNKGGGACWEIDEIIKIKAVCQNNNMALHLDGARLFNALVAKNQSPKKYGQLFDTISICLSKGLGAPVGSLLLGSKEHIAKATRIRKAMGGGMRQAGFIAAAGIYALQNNVERLKIDHERAKSLASVLQNSLFVENIYPVETNIVIFKVNSKIISTAQLIENLKENEINAVSMGNNLVRFVLHLNITDSEFEFLLSKLDQINLNQ
ncbi:MAG: low specificity L-threonine aldolase [Candidatus Methylacidiphilales bacterium]